MNRKVRNIIFVLLGLILAYSVLATLISNYLSKQYGAELNLKRTKLGLQPLDSNWTCDSVEFLQHGNYSINQLKEIPEWSLQLENNKLYCEYWSVYNPTTKFIKTKRVYYFRSLWIWKNRLMAEYDNYQKPLDDIHQSNFYLGYNFLENESFVSIDTLISQSKVDSMRAYAKQNNMYWCGTAAIQMAISLDTKPYQPRVSEALKLLDNWKK